MPESTPRKYLLVDDQEDDLLLLSSLLKAASSSYEIKTCSDGHAALETIQSESFDCLFLDYSLGDMTGVEILKKAIEANPDQAVALVTAMGSEEIAVEAMKLGAADYLVKGSLSLEGLERCLLRIHERNHLRQVVRQQEKELLDAERQRVMMESIGATCHHFSQPVTSLLGRLEMLLASNPQLNDKQRLLLEDCFSCTQRMSDLLAQFQNVRSYRTKPYLSNVDILDIGA